MIIIGKKIDTNELLNNVYKSNSFGDFLVLEYIGKDKDYMYKIKFINTNNEEIVNRKSIISLSCVDKKEKERASKENKKNKQKEEFTRRRHMNKMKGKETYYSTKDNIKVLSLDQSSNYTGYAIWENKKIIDYGLIDLKTKEYSYLEKAITVESLIIDMVKKYKIDLVVMEDIYLGMNLEVFKVLCVVQSNLMISLIKNETDYILASAPQWKPFAGITALAKDRKTQKELSLKIVKSKFNIDCTHDDVSDAILIGYYAINECVKNKADDIDDIWNYEVE